MKRASKWIVKRRRKEKLLNQGREKGDAQEVQKRTKPYQKFQKRTKPYQKFQKRTKLEHRNIDKLVWSAERKDIQGKHKEWH